MAQFGQRLRLELTDPLPGHPEPLPHLFQGPNATVLETEAHDQHLTLAVVEILEGVGSLAFYIDGVKTATTVGPTVSVDRTLVGSGPVLLMWEANVTAGRATGRDIAKATARLRSFVFILESPFSDDGKFLC